MKRSRLGNGRKAMERGSTFENRGGAMERVAPLRPKSKPTANRHLAELNRRLAFLFHDSVQGRPCPVCHERHDYLHAHHCVERGFIERELESLVTPERLRGIVWDARNALGVCASDHMNDHWSMWRRIGRAHLPASAWEFAKELDRMVGDQRFTVRLEAYPDEEREVA